MRTCVRSIKFPKSSRSLVECISSGKNLVGMVILGAAISRSSKNLPEGAQFNSFKKEIAGLYLLP